MEPESTSFNPRTWVGPTVPTDSPLEPTLSDTPAPAKRRPHGVWLAGGTAAIAVIAGLGLLVPWSAFFGKPAAEAREATTTSATPAPAAAPRYDTRIFPAADMNELGLGLEEIGIETGDAFSLPKK